MGCPAAPRPPPTARPFARAVPGPIIIIIINSIVTMRTISINISSMITWQCLFVYIHGSCVLLLMAGVLLWRCAWEDARGVRM